MTIVLLWLLALLSSHTAAFFVPKHPSMLGTSVIVVAGTYIVWFVVESRLDPSFSRSTSSWVDAGDPSDDSKNRSQ